MNIIDDVPENFYDEGMMNEAINYVISALKLNKKVLIHCNQGETRTPSIVLLILRQLGVYTDTFESVEINFKQKYPIYNPTQGIRDYAVHHW